MKTIYRPILVIGLLGFLALAGIASAQGSSPLLNTIELKKLITSGTPADHARLGAHFSALANEYTADAKRHTVMSQAYAGNRNPGLGTTMRNHCRQLADLATRSASILHDLAAYHDKLATHATAVPPADGARFQAGEGTPPPTDKELAALAAGAKTAADHQALEEYFLSAAKRYAAAADADATLAQMYRGQAGRRGGGEAAYNFDRLEKLEREAAKQANEAAEMHRDLAGAAR